MVQRKNELSRGEQFLRDINTFLESNLGNERFGVNDLAEFMSTSRVQLYRKLNSITGKNVSQYIREFRLNRAKQLLEMDVANVSEIAYRVGFSSPGYFSKCFSAYFGYPPGQAKKKENEEDRPPKAPPFEQVRGIAKGLVGILKSPLSVYFKTLAKPNNWIMPTVLLILLSVTLAGVGWNYLQGRNQGTHSAMFPVKKVDAGKSLAVIPFKDLSGDTKNRIYCDGMVMEIIDRLSNLKQLRVPGFTTMEQYRNTSKTIPQIGSDLQVSYIVEGQVLSARDSIRVSVNLLDADRDSLIWSHPFNMDKAAFYTILIDVASEVVSNINLRITQREKERIRKIPTDNSRAIELYIKGREAESKQYFYEMPAYSDSAIMYYKATTEIEPRYAIAYSHLGAEFWEISLLHDAGDSIRERYLDSVKYFTDKALEIDPGLADGYHKRAWYYQAKGEKDSCIANLNRAIELVPNFAGAYASLGLFSDWWGDFNVGIPALEKAKRLSVGDPKFSHIVSLWLVYGYCSIGEFPKAVENARYHVMTDSALSFVGPESPGKIAEIMGDWGLFKKFLDRQCASKNNSWTLFGKVDWFIHQGKYKDALACMEAERKHPISERFTYSYYALSQYGYILSMLHRETEAHNVFKEVIKRCNEELKSDNWHRSYAEFVLAGVYINLNNKEKALDLFHNLEKAQAGLTHLLIQARYDPMFRNIWSDPEFKNIISRQEAKYAAVQKEVDVSLAKQNLDTGYEPE